MTELTITNMENFTKSGKTIVSFYSTTCPPCKRLKPLLDSIEQVEVGRVNVVDNFILANAHGVTSVPTTLLLEDGEISETIVGYFELERIRDFLV